MRIMNLVDKIFIINEYLLLRLKVAEEMLSRKDTEEDGKKFLSDLYLWLSELEKKVYVDIDELEKCKRKN